ncbi:hypothetical protein [Pedobacter hartonius]|uniref:Uncharacterized protein n=1 Tax=Pedobacter hartonius TaxID=425514 RepID=A0A1H3WBP6_9SPHI|nr:hypothetical protein [Pedobacter hartonius]SDZ83688.1 hypothetical protein SAMN05443550_101154 [Pedobacter hartonius]
MPEGPSVVILRENIIKNEVLYRTRVQPLTEVSALKPAKDLPALPSSFPQETCG